MTDTPDHVLIERAQQGDADAMASLYRRYEPVITRYISYRVSEQTVIEDLTRFFHDMNLTSKPAIPSPIKGPKGNTEFLIVLKQVEKQAEDWRPKAEAAFGCQAWDSFSL